MLPSITFLKLGGAVITNKDIPESVRRDVLRRLISEIAKARKERDFLLVLGNGAGSFAHVPASRYKTMHGFQDDEGRLGMAITQDAAARLNRIVVRECLKVGIPAVTLSPANSLVTKSKQARSWCSEVFEEYLHQKLVPVTYGDVLVDQEQGCTIWSTDTVFTFFAKEFEKRGFNVNEIIHVTEAEGVWTSQGQAGKSKGEMEGKEIYAQITPSMKDEVKKSMTDTKGFDVTGGMWHKIEEALKLTELGIQTRIITGLQKDVVYKTLIGDTSFGTVISKE